MAALPALRPIACVAAINAALQGLVGIVLSILALTVCFCGLGSSPTSQNNDFSQHITNYLQGTQCEAQTFILYSGVTSASSLRVWMILSLLFSVSMTASSLVLIAAVGKQWSDEKLQIALVSWLFINLFTAADDLVLGYIFGGDFITALGSSSQQDNVGPFALGVIAFLALRGIYLWLLNLALIIYLFAAARCLHKYLNEQIQNQDQEPIESWPTLDDFSNLSKSDLQRTPTALNPQLTDRVENGRPIGYPEYSAMARWPTLDGQSQTMRMSRPERVDDVKDRRAKTLREYNFKRQDGMDNPAYVEEPKYYVKLQGEIGSTGDDEEYSSDPQPHRERGRERGSQQWEPPRNQESPRIRERARREVISGATQGHYKKNTAESVNPFRWPIPPPPSDDYLEEQGITIPPVDYLEDEPQTTTTTSTGTNRTLSLQEAILDRTLRLKKVPEELRKGF